MIRSEGREFCVRYDGTETRVDIHRGSETDGLSIDELDQLIDVLEDALCARLEFIAKTVKSREKRRRKRCRQ